MENTVVWGVTSILEEPLASVDGVDDTGNALHCPTWRICVSALMTVLSGVQRDYKVTVQCEHVYGLVYTSSDLSVFYLPTDAQ